MCEMRGLNLHRTVLKTTGLDVGSERRPLPAGARRAPAPRGLAVRREPADAAVGGADRTGFHPNPVRCLGFRFIISSGGTAPELNSLQY